VWTSTGDDVAAIASSDDTDAHEREVVRQRALAEARLPHGSRDVDADAALVADVDDVALQGEQRADLHGPHEVDLGDRARRRSAPARNAIDAASHRLGSNAPGRMRQ
jgi:hypothetical protein